MKFFIASILFVSASMISAQRGSYAGNGPIVSGLKQFGSTNNRQLNQPLNSNSIQQPNQFFGNDPYLMNRINQLPAASQPFWFLNRNAINAQIGQQPQPGFGFGMPVPSFQPGNFVAGR